MKAKAKQKPSFWSKIVAAYGNDGHVDYIFLSLVIILFTAGIITVSYTHLTLPTMAVV